jgi:hypothetical protein
MARGETPQSGRPTKSAEMKFRLPGDLHAQIETAATDHGWSASEEIRRRLEGSFEIALAADDPKTRDLVVAITETARNLAETYGRAWHEDAWSRDVMLAAITVLVRTKAPRGDPKYNPKPEHLADLIWGENERDPSVAGRMLAMMQLTGSAKGRP